MFNLNVFVPRLELHRTNLHKVVNQVSINLQDRKNNHVCVYKCLIEMDELEEPALTPLPVLHIKPTSIWWRRIFVCPMFCGLGWVLGHNNRRYITANSQNVDVPGQFQRGRNSNGHLRYRSAFGTLVAPACVIIHYGEHRSHCSTDFCRQKIASANPILSVRSQSSLISEELEVMTGVPES